MSSEKERLEAVEAENERLKARLAELERRLDALLAAPARPAAPAGTAPRAADLHRWESAALLRDILDNTSTLIYAKDLNGRYTLMSRTCESSLGLRPEDVLGKTDMEFLPREEAELFRRQDEQAFASKLATFETRTIVDGAERIYHTTKFPLHDASGEVYGLCCMSADITDRVRAEEEIRRLHEQLLRAHAEAVRALSTPLLPIADGVVVMPLIGEVTLERAAQVIEELLHGVAAQQARIAILDITGVPAAGTEVTQAICAAATAVKQLGAQIVITGIRPNVERSLVELGADLQGVVTRSTLQSGVQYALAR